MKLIEHNPFRILGIPVNATAKDLAANKGKMKLLDIGKEVSFALDLPTLMSSISRTKDDITSAERDTNLPQDKVRHSLFWFAQPSDPVGKLGYDHLLQGNIDSAFINFGRSNSWEARLCLATLCLQQGKPAEALAHIAYVIDNHCDEFVHAVAGQTHTETPDSLRHDYVMALAEEIDVAALYQQIVNQQKPDEDDLPF